MRTAGKNCRLLIIVLAQNIFCERKTVQYHSYACIYRHFCPLYSFPLWIQERFVLRPTKPIDPTEDRTNSLGETLRFKYSLLRFKYSRFKYTFGNFRILRFLDFLKIFAISETKRLEIIFFWQIFEEYL